MKNRSIIDFTVIAAGVLSLVSVPAMAQTPGGLSRAVAEALVDYLTSPSSDSSYATYATARGDADLVNITDYRIGGEIGGTQLTLVFPTVAVSHPRLRDEGGFTADSLTFDHGFVELDGEVVGGWMRGSSAPTIVPSREEALRYTANPWRGYPESTTFRIDSVHLMGASIDYVDISGGWEEASFVVAGFDLPFAAVGIPPGDPTHAALGISSFAADLSAVLSVGFADGDGGVDSIAMEGTLSFASLGILDFKAAFSGPDLMANLADSGADGVAGSGKTGKGGRQNPSAPPPGSGGFIDSFRLTLSDRGFLTIPGAMASIEAALLQLLETIREEYRAEGLAAIERFLHEEHRSITFSAIPATR